MKFYSLSIPIAIITSELSGALTTGRTHLANSALGQIPDGAHAPQSFQVRVLSNQPPCAGQDCYSSLVVRREEPAERTVIEENERDALGFTRGTGTAKVRRASKEEADDLQDESDDAVNNAVAIRRAVDTVGDVSGALPSRRVGLRETRSLEAQQPPLTPSPRPAASSSKYDSGDDESLDPSRTGYTDEDEDEDDDAEPSDYGVHKKYREAYQALSQLEAELPSKEAAVKEAEKAAKSADDQLATATYQGASQKEMKKYEQNLIDTDLGRTQSESNLRKIKSRISGLQKIVNDIQNAPPRKRDAPARGPGVNPN